ncbi:MAG: RidA family protein [Gemmatimonadota bacterium]
MSFRILNPDALAKPRGWNHGLLADAGGRVLFVAGQTATDARGEAAGLDFAAQFERALANVLAVVREAGGRPEDVGRLTIYVTDLEAYRSCRKELGEAYRRHMGGHYPAMALVEVAGLVDEGAAVEIEATAVIPPTPSTQETGRT